SSTGSIDDSLQLAANLGVRAEQLSIEKPFQAYLDLLEPYFQGKPVDATEENLQARCRGMILMAISNKLGYIVLSTGNKSELAMGYATLYGDMCGGVGVISDVTKSQVYDLANWINRDKMIIPLNILRKPPSAELKPNQKDSDTLPEYEIIDNVLKAYVEEHYSPEEISQEYHYPLELVQDLVRRIHCNEYKRRQSPPGLRVSQKSFSVGRRFPIVQRWVSK
ncbi:MAG TPA: NAD(+) synthase, partial [Waddliaceae bacterium]